MRKFLIVASAVLSLALLGCDSARDQALPTNLEDPRLKEAAQKLSDEDKKLLLDYLMRREMAKAFGGSVGDTAQTIGDAIQSQRAYLASMTESERRAEQLKAETEQKRKAISDQIAKAVTVAFIDAKFSPSDFRSGQYEDYEELSFAVRNLGPKAIKGLKGKAIWYDTFGEEYTSVGAAFEETVEPGQTKTLSLGKEINKFMDEDKKIMTLDSGRPFKFIPEQIVFADGTNIKAPTVPATP